MQPTTFMIIDDDEADLGPVVHDADLDRDLDRLADDGGPCELGSPKAAPAEMLGSSWGFLGGGPIGNSRSIRHS